MIGTAGHIDHGKSTLVRALTGTDPDRLEEEKRRGITIDLGFAHLDLGDGLQVGFVDVPGHERFVKNMLAGAGGIDLVLLVVAADESIKPQTREHFDICRLLGIPKGLIVITKCDLAAPEMLDLVRLEVQELVRGSFLENAPIIPASARTGEGLEAVKRELQRLSLGIVPKPGDLPFRLPIDRSFVMKGFGTVVTGTLIAGSITKDSDAELFPEQRRVRVRGIQVHNSSVEAATAGQRTAVNLSGIDAKEITRGMTLAVPDLFQASSRLDVSLAMLPTARPLKNRAKVHFHSGTLETVAEVILLGAKELAPAGHGYAQLRLADPGLFLPRDRFIVRQFSPLATIGGGVVVDNLPAKRRMGDPGAAQFLESMEKGSDEDRLELLTRAAGEVAVAGLAARMGRSREDLYRLGESLETKKQLIALGRPPAIFVHAEHFQELAGRIVHYLESFHAANPLMPGVAKEDLRGRIATADRMATPPSPAAFNAVLQRLSTENEVELQGETVRRAGRGVKLTAEESAARDEIARAFETAGLAVPTASAVLAELKIDRARAEKILQILLKEKLLVKVAEEMIFHQSALARLRDLVRQQKTKNPRIDVRSFKELSGLTRKYAIPLLEYLDRERVTRRDGEARIIL